MKKNSKLKQTTLIILLILLLSTGLSFAYFSATITGGEDKTTISVAAGVMNIHYDGGDNITANNISPSNNAFATKTFTVTGNNTTDLDMVYKIFLVVDENTFTNGVIQYKLISTNTDNFGEPAPSTGMKRITTGVSQKSLGKGEFLNRTNGNKFHTYNLELYFPETSINQNKDQCKTFKANINIKEGEKFNYILAEDSDFEFIAAAYDAQNIYNGSQGYFKYIGAKEYVIIPEKINGETLKDYYLMFDNSDMIKGVSSNNLDVTDMRCMFWGATIATLDLSSFNTSNVIYMGWMFGNCTATIGYARTLEDANRFNSSSYKPSTLNFVVK